MARARNIKPGFFKNEDLAECSPWARLCFAGLWCLADRDGRLEDRPKRIKGELFPFDTVDVEHLLQELERWKFILRYEADGVNAIQILGFAAHQTPHYTEKAGCIKPPPGWSAAPMKEGRTQEDSRSEAGMKPDALREDSRSEAGMKPDALREDSRSEAGMKRGSKPPDSLIPDSLIPESPLPPDGGGDGFAQFWSAYPRKVGKDKARKAFEKRKPGGELLARMLVAIAEQAKSAQWQRDGGQYIPHPATWLNEGRWQDEVGGTATGAPALAVDDPLRAQIAALPTDWWRLAGFESKWDAEASRCSWMNYTEFRDRKRIVSPEGVTA